MTDYLVIPLTLVILAAPGLAGFLLVSWRNARTPEPWPPWAGWFAGAGGTIALCAAGWAYALSVERASGLDDGSVGMGLAMLLASLVANGLAGAALAVWRR